LNILEHHHDSEKSDEASEPFGSAYANRDMGSLTGESHIKVVGADDSDNSTVITYASLGKSCKALRDGRIVVWANLEALCCSRFSGSVKRECGFFQDVDVFEDAQIRFCLFNVSTGDHECKWARLTGEDKTPSPFHLTYPKDEPD